MYKAELVVYTTPFKTAQDYLTGNFQQASIVGESMDSYESAMKDAYNVAFKKYGVTSDDIAYNNKWVSKYAYTTKDD